MRYLLAMILPFLAVILCGRIVTGLVLLLLQLTLIGWIPAAVIACLIVSSHNADRRTARQTKALASAVRRAGRGQ